MRKFPHSVFLKQSALFILMSALASVAGAQSAKRALDANVYIDVSHDVLPSVVNISIDPSKNPTGDDDYDSMLQYFNDKGSDPDAAGGLPPWLQSAVSASGVVFKVKDGMGYILTNNHVVETTTESKMDLKLTFHQRSPGSTDYNLTTVISGDDVRVTGTDQLTDLAVIEFKKPEELKIEPIEFADSDKVEIGENVLALGNPLGLNHSITQGIVSGKSRDLGTKISLSKLFQTSVVIQPGNSGGPLVNLDGKIIGINNAILSATGFWQGTSFAIPGNDAKEIAEQIVDNGRAMRGYLGVTMDDVGRYSRKIMEPYALGKEAGVVITIVVRNSPADVAGVHAADVVTEIDGKRIQSVEEMLRNIATREIDSDIQLTVVRLDEAKKPINLKLSAKLTERPRDEIVKKMHLRERNSNQSVPRVPESADNVEDLYLGMDIEPFYDKDSKTGGLLVKDLSEDSKPYQGGIRSGDVVTGLNGRNVTSIPDFLDAMSRPVDGKNHVIAYLHDGAPLNTEFKAD